MILETGNWSWAQLDNSLIGWVPSCNLVQQWLGQVALLLPLTGDRMDYLRLPMRSHPPTRDYSHGRQVRLPDRTEVHKNILMPRLSDDTVISAAVYKPKRSMRPTR